MTEAEGTLESDPHPTKHKMGTVQFASQFGMAIGMTFGSLVGMSPLYFLDTKKSETLKKKVVL
jgi:hypothetical protein